jgi:hypothetical protein
MEEAPKDRSLAVAAWLVVAGTILSGPVGMLLASLRPQPRWVNAATFLDHFHPLQQLPFWFGLLLLVACVLFVARAAAIAPAAETAKALGAVVSVSVYAAMVGVNYVLQIAWVPELARARDPAVAYVTMANPASAAWALEMFGYGALGAATWLIAPVFRGARLGGWIEGMLIANGVVSIVGAAVTGVQLRWVLSTPGLVSFAAWNALFVVVMALCALSQRR